MTEDFTALTDRLASPDTGLEAALWVPLMRLLSQGDPVDIADLAAAAGRTIPEVRAALAAVPDTEYDGEGRIIGQALTLRPTQHRFEMNGKQLYTWCALDTLIFPALLGATARVESACHATGAPILLNSGAGSVTGVQPATAVVSLINPEDMSSIRSAFCNQVHFFASAETAQPWLDANTDGSIVPIAEALRLGTAMAEALLNETPPTQRGSQKNGVHGCAC